MLGVPLLAVLGKEQMLAVISHEFGHFSRRHGRLGHWLYRVRIGWMRYAEHVSASDSPLDRATALYARQFVPFFSARCFAHSRTCEYEADRDAASVAGPGVVAEALTRVAAVAHLWEHQLPGQVRAWRSELPDPPEDFLERFMRLVAESPSEDLNSGVRDALAAPARPHDTHPSLSERLKALGQEPVLVKPMVSAGEALFGAEWASLLAEFNERWAKEMRPGWLLEHLRLKHMVLPLLRAGDVDRRTWDLSRRLAWAKAMREMEPARGLDVLRELHQEDPKNLRVRFALAAALLAEGDDAGVKLMEAVAREGASFRIPAFQRVITFFERKGDVQQVERWSAWRTQAFTALGTSVGDLVLAMEAGRGSDSDMDPGARSVVKEAVQRDICVKKGWLMKGAVRMDHTVGRPVEIIQVHFLALAIDPAAAERADEDEDDVARRYEVLVQSLIPPDELAFAQTYFTTERIPDGFGPQHSMVS
jgi:hypothetical protein